MRLTGQSFGVAVEREEADSDLGLHLEAGAFLALSPSTGLGLEVRRLWLRGDFNGVTNGRADIGGRFISLGLRYRP